MAAIYGWHSNNILLLTTTLYPIVVIDSLDISVSIISGEFLPLPKSDVQSTFDVKDGTYIQKRWFYTDGPYNSDIKGTFSVNNGTYIQLRWFLTDGPYDSNVQGTFGVENGTLINKVVDADSPDEELQLNIVISNTSTMDLI